MPILHLGVMDIPYAPPPTRRTRKKPRVGTVTTGDVAGWLEDRYHIMENFYELHEGEIYTDIEDSLAGAVESLIRGAPIDLAAFGSATSKIEERFRRFLSMGEMEKIGYPGVPTQAALQGISHRMKSRKSTRRPSFVDTGLYSASFKTWVD